MTVVPSRYQQAIFDYIQYETGHLVVEAVAGSGKSTSLVEAAKLLPPTAKALFAAFNNHIAAELGTKLKEAGSMMECRTVHSLGKSILDRTFKTQKIEGYKYGNLCRDYLQTRNIVDRRISQQMSKLVDAVRLTLTQPTEANLIKIINHYGMDDVEMFEYGWYEMVEGLPSVLEAGKKLYQQAGIIDFTDMLYLPIALDLPCPKYDVLMLDEAQDFNAAQLALIMKCCPVNGRMIFCADRKQAIQGFAFADTNSVNNIVARTGAQIKPLSICYRCASSVVAMAQQIVPTIEASPTAISGEVQVLNSEHLITLVQPGDMVICRTTAPLVEKCLLLLRAGIKAVVRGKDIGKSFIDLLAKLRKRRGFALETLGDLVEVYRREQINTLLNVPDSEMKIASLEDKVDTFVALYEAYLNKGMGSIPQFEEYIQSFFSDDESNGTKPVMFSTVHKSKGLEAQRVFILRPDLFPHPAAKKDWQLEQEYNIEYVALTRAKEHLYFVGGLPGNLHLPQPEPTLFDDLIDDDEPASVMTDTEAVALLAPAEALMDTLTERERDTKPVYPFADMTVNTKGDIRLDSRVVVTLKAIEKHHPEIVRHGVVRRIDRNSFASGDDGYLVELDGSAGQYYFSGDQVQPETIAQEAEEEQVEPVRPVAEIFAMIDEVRGEVQGPHRRGRTPAEPTKKKDFRLPVNLLEALKAVADESGMNDTALIIEMLKSDPRIQQKLNVMTEKEEVKA